MKKLFINTLLISLLLFVSLGHAETPMDLLTKYGVPSVGSGQYEPVGRLFFVDSGSDYRADSADHGTWDKPFATLDYAVGRCTDNNGDVIVLSPGHINATMDAVDEIDVDVAGVRIIGLGEGNDRATFTYTGTAGEFVIGAANVTVENLRFVAGVSNVTMAISVEALGDNFTLRNCEVPEPSDAAFEFADIIDLAAGADNVTIDGMIVRQLGVTPGDLDHFLEAGTGVNNRLTIINSVIEGEFLVSAIWSDTADTEVLIDNCVITNATNGEHAIEFTSTARGAVDNTLLRTNAAATSIDPGSLTIGANVTWDDDTTPDTVAAPPVAGGGVAVALTDIDLDHLINTAAGTDVYPVPLTTDSILAMVMAKGAAATANTYNNTTDSLEAIADRDADILADTVTISGGTLPAVPTAGSLSTFISGGSVGLGQPLPASTSLTDIVGNFTGPYNGAAQDDNIKASLDLAHTDLDAIIAAVSPGPYYTSTATAGAVTGWTDTAFIGLFEDDYFNTGWTAVCIFADVGAPEEEWRDISDYDDGTGVFTVAVNWTVAPAATDVIVIYRDEALYTAKAALPAIPTANSLAAFIASGGTALGTELGDSASIVDALGTDGVTPIDTAVSVLGAIGVNDANNVMDTTAVLPNADGSAFERLEYLAQMSEQALAAMQAAGRTVGNVFYVDDAGGGGDGSTWALAEVTLQAAIDDCAANTGDIVFVAPGHSEDIGAVTIAVDAAGISIIGLGTGTDTSTLVFNDAASVIAVSVANCTIKNLLLSSTTIDTTVSITLAAGADNTVLDGLRWIADAGGGFGFVDLVTFATGANDVTVKNCDVYLIAADADTWLNLTTGIDIGLIVKDNHVWGDFAEAAIYGDQVHTRMQIFGNTINNLESGDHAIWLSAAATGIIHDNVIMGDTPWALLDPGSCVVYDNRLVKSDTADSNSNGLLDINDGGWFYTTGSHTASGAAGFDGVFTVLGRVEVKAYAEVTTTYTAHGDTISFGPQDSPALIIAATAGNAPLTEHDIWLNATSARAAVMQAQPSFIVNGIGGGVNDLGITESGNNLAAGVVQLHVYWRPLEEGAYVDPI